MDQISIADLEYANVMVMVSESMNGCIGGGIEGIQRFAQRKKSFYQYKEERDKSTSCAFIHCMSQSVKLGEEQMQVEVQWRILNACMDRSISQHCPFNIEINRWVIKASYHFSQSLHCSVVQEVAEGGDQAVVVQGYGFGHPIIWQ